MDLGGENAEGHARVFFLRNLGESKIGDAIFRLQQQDCVLCKMFKWNKVAL